METTAAETDWKSLKRRGNTMGVRFCVKGFEYNTMGVNLKIFQLRIANKAKEN